MARQIFQPARAFDPIEIIWEKTAYILAMKTRFLLQFGIISIGKKKTEPRYFRKCKHFKKDNKWKADYHESKSICVGLYYSFELRLAHDI